MHGIAFFCQFIITLQKTIPSRLPLHQPVFLVHTNTHARTHTPCRHKEEACIWGSFPRWTKNVTLSEEITGLQQRLCFNAFGLMHSLLTQKNECVQNVFVAVNVKVGVSKHCVHVYLQFRAGFCAGLRSGTVKVMFRDSGGKMAVSWIKWLFRQTFLGHSVSGLCVCVCVLAYGLFYGFLGILPVIMTGCACLYDRTQGANLSSAKLSFMSSHWWLQLRPWEGLN